MRTAPSSPTLIDILYSSTPSSKVLYFKLTSLKFIHQGITWIKEKEKVNNLKVLRLGSKFINRDLELSIENGYSAIIENMSERIDAILMPIIARQFIKRGKNKILKFAGKDLTLSEKFKLFLHTKLSNPHYPPEI